MTSVFKLLYLICVFVPFVSSRHVQFYRKDYVYIEEFDAFYKVHWDLYGLSWNSAFLACDDEGASLFYPNMEGEWLLVKNLTSNMTEPPNVTDIFVGLHDEFGVGEFITVDGHSTPTPLDLEESTNTSHLPEEKACVLMNINTGLYKIGSCDNFQDNPVPFICKKVDNESCPTIDRGYKYAKSLKKCYKVNKKSKMWDEAMKTCFMEGGILAVFENIGQGDVLGNDLDRGLSYHIGIRRAFSHSDYYTVKGQKYDMKLIQNNYGNQYDCVALYFDGAACTANSVECGSRLPFICEMDLAN